MKKFIFALPLFLPLASFAQADDTLKICRTSMADLMTVPPAKFPVTFTIIKRGDAVVTQASFPTDPSTKLPEIKSELGEFPIGPGLSKIDEKVPPSETDKLNKGEKEGRSVST